MIVGVMLMYQPPLMLDRIRRGTMKSSTAAQDKVPISIKGMPDNEHRTPPIRLTVTCPTSFLSRNMLAIHGAITAKRDIDMFVL